MRSYIRDQARYLILVTTLLILLLHMYGQTETQAENVDIRLDIQLDRDTRYLTGRVSKKTPPPSDPQTDVIVERREGRSRGEMRERKAERSHDERR